MINFVYNAIAHVPRDSQLASQVESMRSAAVAQRAESVIAFDHVGLCGSKVRVPLLVQPILRQRQFAAQSVDGNSLASMKVRRRPGAFQHLATQTGSE